MKKMLGSILLFISLVHSAYAYVGFDVCNYGNEKVNSVLCYGPAVLMGTTIQGNVKVAGSLNATHVTMGAMEIIGTVEINDATINGDVEITGSLNATKTVFKGNIKLITADAQFKSSTVNGAIVMYAGKNKPIITIACGSKLMGSVTFAEEPGVVRMSPDSIVEGKLINGTIETIRFNCNAKPR